jgi:hypothetical protein
VGTTWAQNWVEEARALCGLEELKRLVNRWCSEWVYIWNAFWIYFDKCQKENFLTGGQTIADLQPTHSWSKIPTAYVSCALHHPSVWGAMDVYSVPFSKENWGLHFSEHC